MAGTAYKGNWLAGCFAEEAIALDGKSVYGTKGSMGKDVHLVSAFHHSESGYQSAAAEGVQ